MGRLGDSKGAELVRNLGQVLSARKPLPPPPKEPTTPSLEQQLLAKAKSKPQRPPKVKFNAKGGGKKPKVTLIKPRDKAEREQLQAALKGVESKASGPPKTSGATGYDFGEAAFCRLRPYRDSLEDFVATHYCSSAPSEQDRVVAVERVRMGVKAIPLLVEPDDGYFLGYDFGTSTTKAVLRYPYGGVDEAFAIDVPATLCGAGQPHLWPTAVWYNKETKRFSLVPEGSAILLDSFKAALLQKRGHRICKASGLTMEEAATAFVALHVAYCLGTAIEQIDGFALAGVNVGIPVAALTANEGEATFDRIARAALTLVSSAADLTIENVRTALATAQSAPVPYSLHAELSGAIAGYCAAPRFYIGGHMIIDCGSATLDMASFDLDQSNWPVGIYGALVENLGADACESFVDQGVTVEDCRKACRFEEHSVFKETLRRRPGLFRQEGTGYPYQIILVGGGIHSGVHQPFFEKVQAAFARPFHRPAVAPTLRYDRACEPGRLILADGLARDPIDLKEVRLPPEPAPISFREPTYIGPEQV